MNADVQERVRAFKGLFIKKAMFFGWLASSVFFAMYFSTFLSAKNYIKDVHSMQCQQPNYSERISFSLFNERNPDNDFYYFFGLEYFWNERSWKRTFQIYRRTISLRESYDDYQSFDKYKPKRVGLIPVILFPGVFDTTDSHQFLAKTLEERTEESHRKFFGSKRDWKSMLRRPLSFHWLAMNVFQGLSYATDGGLRRHIDFTYNYINTTEADFKEKAIYMCHGMGGGMCYWYGNAWRNYTGLVILESAPSIFPHDYTTQVSRWLHQNRNDFPQLHTNVGKISFEGGFDDYKVHPSWFLWKDESVPVWTIDGVPDNGLSAKGMHVCKPYLDLIADLLMEYKIHAETKSATGKSVLKSFYKKWLDEKKRLLPDDWENEKQNGLMKVQIGETSNLVVNGSLWIEIDVQRNTSAVLQITGSCLTAATIIRHQSYIKRKDKPFNSSIFEFGIYQMLPFESVRFFLESNTECHVTIETSPWWLEYTQRFFYGMVVDPHNFWVAAHVTFVFLACLESDKRSYRWEHQIYAYTVFIFAVLYHTFSTFGVENSGLICGAGLSIAVHSVCSSCHEIILMRIARRSLDHLLQKPHRYLIISMLAGSAIFCSLSSATSALVIFLMFTWTIRPMLLPAAAIAHIPIIYRILNQPMRYRSDESWSLEQIQISYSFVFCALCFSACYVFRFSHPENVVSRVIFHLLTYSCFIFQFLRCGLSLDLHYALGITILAVNHSRIQHVPREIFGVVDQEKLERAYRKQDDEDN